MNPDAQNKLSGNIEDSLGIPDSQHKYVRFSTINNNQII